MSSLPACSAYAYTLQMTQHDTSVLSILPVVTASHIPVPAFDRVRRPCHVMVQCIVGEQFQNLSNTLSHLQMCGVMDKYLYSSYKKAIFNHLYPINNIFVSHVHTVQNSDSAWTPKEVRVDCALISEACCICTYAYCYACIYVYV
jgi:hypothetical protein